MVKQERATRTRNALIRSAAEVFDREGFPNASLSAISSLAGVSNGALHFHFASKAVLAAAVEGAALSRLADLTGGAPPPGPGPHVQLLIDVTHRLAAAQRGDAVLRAGFALADEVSRPTRGDLREQWRHWVRGALEQAYSAGELGAGVTVRDAETAVVAATVGFEALGVRDPVWLSPATVTRFWRLLLPTVVPADRLDDLDPAGTSLTRP
ncbi:TetR/AcrR family transcriptional regulator [Streptomyces bambusae]|uniref:ScbR family autoregulator-binding transcription factor n=1 Tax=Streptomyces bambusae TaxID=1550616 RepID=UPI001CFF0DDE|nr:ScbR family autoregulator-binding transcription factor [Streptomyces bambusae]MCB5168298.1 TetR/AcrR family transcriptional regulator [Streptomyces bambusae]